MHFAARNTLFVSLFYVTHFGCAANAAQPSAQSCEQLKSLARPDFEIVAVGLVPAGKLGTRGPGAEEQLPEHCRLEGNLNPRIGAGGQRFGIGFELRLPTQWNGRFVFQGGGGLDGVLNPALGMAGTGAPTALARGFAVVSNDGGHRGKSMLDASFGIDQQARLDYAFNSMDRVTLKAKELIATYYGRAPEYSYLLGCSNGGRQGLMAAQRYPLHYDGIVAGAPIFNMSRIVMNQIWNVQTFARVAPRNAAGEPILSAAFSDADLKLVADSALRRCDAHDGLADGMINDLPACKFDPAELACKGAKSDACLSKQQVSALHDWSRGAHTPQGQALYGRFPYDTGIANPLWRGMHIGRSTTAKPDASDVVLGFESLRQYMMNPPQPTFDPMTFDFDRHLARIRDMQAFSDADATFLQTYAQRGKLLLYHGVSDQGMAAGALTDWYERTGRDTGGKTQDWARLFLVPGMMHCGGGQSTDRFDTLSALQAWVEQGKAPDRIVATSSTIPGISRPLCPYPTVARYDSGDASKASSFSCKP
jgi:tannase/feruloyl esterase